MKKTLLIAVMAVSTIFAQAQAWQSNTKFCGEYISSINVNDLATLAQVTSGTITFDYASNTLTLTDVVWTRPSSAIYYFICAEDMTKPLNVVFNGTNSFDNNSMQRVIIHSEPDTEVRVIGRSPKLDVVNIKGGNGINMSSSHMTIKNLTLNFEDNDWTIGGWGPTVRSQLVIDFCNITAHPKNYMFDDLTSFQLIDCQFKTPVDAAFDATQFAVVSEGAKLKDIDVEIEAKATAIPQVHAQKQAGKVIKDGQLYIERNGELFDVTGARVK